MMRVMSPGGRVHRLNDTGNGTLCGEHIRVIDMTDRRASRVSVFPSGGIWRVASYPTCEYLFADECSACNGIIGVEGTDEMRFE
jgi:hypothetical protein